MYGGIIKPRFFHIAVEIKERILSSVFSKIIYNFMLTIFIQIPHWMNLCTIEGVYICKAELVSNDVVNFIIYGNAISVNIFIK